jgi:hypothetical protein
MGWCCEKEAFAPAYSSIHAQCAAYALRQRSKFGVHFLQPRLETQASSCNNPAMPDRSSKRQKRPRDANQLAKSIVDMATGETPAPVDDGKNPAAVALGRLGGAKGGKARAAKLSAARRKAIAKKAAAARWKR